VGMVAIIRFRVLFSRLVFKNIKLKMFRAVVLSFVLFGLRNFVFYLSEEDGLRRLENRVLREVFRPRGGINSRGMSEIAQWASCFVPSTIIIVNQGG